MRKITLLIFLFLTAASGFCQVGNYNQFPGITPNHTLDAKLENISFAYGLRLLESDYDGPFVRLRRASDNAQMDFGCNDVDMVDVDAINTWRAGSNVFVVTWYDQSGLGRHAQQPVLSRQPRFFPDPTNPYIVPENNSQYLDTQTNIQIATNAGANATIVMVLRPVERVQYNFGNFRNNAERWTPHMNWTSGQVFFDPGFCCATNRSFANRAFTDQWSQYTLQRGTTSILIRRNNTTQVSGAFPNRRYTLNQNFFLLAANTGGNPNLTSRSPMAEFIMYNTDIALSIITEIEEDQIAFWDL
ncbi:hypothetical protein EAX61_15845 [Dokdonia sinensis]|uniref:Uncharacterized protein n=1 Tax=Dokdonia sinensis TaxID=2479847 RepID=A0A3M0GFK6_9FLAO|nr:arabinofuranosidase catalytic domain-containing protein [Dokdonia sinensis]RMB56096.1 hypothetical protein EAX61_15845 [Dokdonia sinensis]